MSGENIKHVKQSQKRTSTTHSLDVDTAYRRSTLSLLTTFLGLLGSAILPAFTFTPIFGQSPSSPNKYLALVGATIYVSPSEEAIRDGVVLIQGGKISAVGKRRVVQVPQTARVLDCSDLAITAGFWNSHVHFFERKWANAATIPVPERISLS